MEEENKEGTAENQLSTLTKEEVLETIKGIFKDNEESLKYIDNITSSLVEIKRLEANNPRSTSFATWILPILLVFGPSLDGLDKDLLNKVEDETDKTKL